MARFKVLTGSGKAKPTSPKVKTAVKKKVTATAASKKPKVGNGWLFLSTCPLMYVLGNKG